MSGVIETFLMCDTCFNNFGVDDRQRNVTQQRMAAKENGWVYSGGKDYCPNCKKKKDKVIPPIYKKLKPNEQRRKIHNANR